MTKISGIYCIINLDNGKMYIGSSKNIQRRIKEHFSLLNKNRHVNIHLQNSFNKHGMKRFSFLILEETENLLVREQYYITTMLNLYNIATDASRVFDWTGRCHTEKTILKMAKSAIDTRIRKLTVDVVKIRDLASNNVAYSKIAKMFNIANSTVYKIVKRKKWAHI